MLAELSIKNLAIIDDLSVTFSGGLTVLSGETGAGKSIIINAVNLILGNRASAKLIRTGEDSAEIEAFFTLREDSQVAGLMREQGLEPRDGLLIRRIISANDRHKIFINGRMGTIQMLADITQNLASISGQHAHQGLLKEDQHLQLLDQFGDLLPLREKVAGFFASLQPLLSSLRKYTAMEQKQAQHLEFIRFQKNDIEQAGITSNEDDELEQTRLRLRHGETLRTTVQRALNDLYQMDGSVFERLSDLHKDMEKALELDPTLEKTAGDLSDITYRVEDMARALREYEDRINTDSSLLEEVEARLDVLNKLKRKYAGTGGSLADVQALYESLCVELSEVENLSTTIADIETDIARIHEKLVEASRKLSGKRAKAAETLSLLVEGQLDGLDMKKTRFEVQVVPMPADAGTPEWLKDGDHAIQETGQDRVMFMISPNVGEDMKPLAKIASGGELSRVVLALKAILAATDSVETVVFDEVDAGIGGGVAEKVGEKIRDLSLLHQVICITHLPQIAKFGARHYKIEKTIQNGRTCTGIRPLTDDQRIEELARMLGGTKITETTLAHAREMLDQA